MKLTLSAKNLIKKYFKGLIGIKTEVLEGMRLVKTQLALYRLLTSCQELCQAFCLHLIQFQSGVVDNVDPLLKTEPRLKDVPLF